MKGSFNVDTIDLPGNAGESVGQPVRRKEDLRLITGRGRFSDDFRLEGQTWAAMVRSPHPHARIRAIDGSRARAMPGVLGVFTGADAAADGLGPIPHSPVPSTRHDMKLHGKGGSTVFIGPHLLLPVDRARHVGEAVAMVVADSPGRALDAAEAVDIDWEPLPWIAQWDEALADGAPSVWDEVPDNTPVDTWFGDQAGTEAAFAKADHVVRLDLHIGRVTAVAMEPRSALAHYDAASGHYTLWAGSGGAVRQKRELASVLGVDPANVRVLSFDVGGNFGSRNRAFVEFGLVMWASRKVGRPVKFTASRSESFLSDYQGRDLATTVELAVRKDGRFLALRASNVSNLGARCVSLSPLSKGSGLVTGSYDIPVASLRSRAVFTNTMPTQAYRSSGRPEVTYAIERLVDQAAVELGMDRIELRRMNLVRDEAFPYRNGVGAVYDSGEYAGNLDRALRLADWSGFAARRAQAESRGKLLGLGLAHYVESSIGSPLERAELKVDPAGRLRLVIGTQPSGQGHETSFAQVVAAQLGIPVSAIDVVMGDTDIVKAGGGSHSGRSMRHAATVISKATVMLIEQARQHAAAVMEVAAADVTFFDGRFTVQGTDRSLDWFALADRIKAHTVLEVGTDNEMHDPVFPNGCTVCECEIDPETGEMIITRYAAIDDVGRCINPMIVHGQTHGGIVQGVGQAVSEQFVIDPESGQPVCGSLMDYCLPRADTVPSFETEIVEVLSPTNPLGIKAGGEGGTTPALAVIVSAVLDALRPLGVTSMDMPVTPQKLWRAIHDARAAKAVA
jgi:carbon-monoxide dehydrogenase large subunit